MTSRHRAGSERKMIMALDDNKVSALPANTMNVRRLDTEIDDVMNWAADAEENGTSSFPGMTFEQGVACMGAWLLGQSEDNPKEG